MCGAFQSESFLTISHSAQSEYLSAKIYLYVGMCVGTMHALLFLQATCNYLEQPRNII